MYFIIFHNSLQRKQKCRIQGRIRAPQRRKWRSRYAKWPSRVHLCLKCKRNYDKQFTRNFCKYCTSSLACLVQSDQMHLPTHTWPTLLFYFLNSRILFIFVGQRLFAPTTVWMRIFSPVIYTVTVQIRIFPPRPVIYTVTVRIRIFVLLFAPWWCELGFLFCYSHVHRDGANFCSVIHTMMVRIRIFVDVIHTYTVTVRIRIFVLLFTRTLWRCE